MLLASASITSAVSCSSPTCSRASPAAPWWVSSRADPARRLALLAVIARRSRGPLAAFLCGLYAREDLRAWASGVSEAPRLTLSCLALSWPIYGAARLDRRPARPAAGAFFGTPCCAAVAGLARSGARLAVHRAPKLRQRTLIVGSGLVAERLAERSSDHPELGLALTGFIDDGAGDRGPDRCPRSAGSARSSDLVELDRVDRVMIAFSRAHHEELLQCSASAATRAWPSTSSRGCSSSSTAPARSTRSAACRCSRSTRRPSRAPLAVSQARARHRRAPALALLVLPPLLIAIAIAIKLDSRGPVLFLQRRSGRGGEFFTLYKFRSMYVGATVEVRDDGAIVKSRDDRADHARRPLHPPLLARRGAAAAQRAQGRHEPRRPAPARDGRGGRADATGRRAAPTCARASPARGRSPGRSNIPFQEMVRFDYQYVAGWSLARDIEILLATIPAVLSGRGAY